MTDKKTEQRDAMIDEALVETFPASDAPSWTLGVELADESVAAKGGTYARRHAVMQLLSDDEVARVSTREAGAPLSEGEAYLDLARPERGELRVEAGATLVMGEVVPRSAVSAETWAKLLQAVHEGWADPKG